MKKVRTPSEMEAAAAGRKRALFIAVIAFAVGVVMLLVSSSFLQLHCVMALAVALSGGIAAARAAIPIDRGSYRSAGVTGGLYATLAYALPFILFNLYMLFTLNEATLGARIAQLSPEQIALSQQFDVVLDVENFRRQDTSYVFGYFLFALLFGWIVGALGGVLAKRQMDPI
jgi:hypothetical protein